MSNLNKNQKYDDEKDLYFPSPEEVFDEYTIITEKKTDDTLKIIAELPPYMGVIISRISYLIVENQNGEKAAIYISPLRKEADAIIIDDSVTVDIKVKKILSSLVYNELDKKLQLYRTIGLPNTYRPHILDQKSPVMLYYHSRQVDSIKYDTHNSWISTLRYLSNGNHIYAGPISILMEDSDIIIKYYLIITSPEAPGLHFFLIYERFEEKSDRLNMINTTVHFFPYVRVDNLLSLYGGYFSQEEVERHPIKIKR